MAERYEDRPRIGRDELDALFERLGSALEKRVTAWDIGGSPMVYRGLKAGTKDADLVVGTPEQRDVLIDLLTKRPFGYVVEGFLPGYEGLEGKLLRKEGALGVDLFVETIMEGFRLSQGMKDRADGPHTFGKLLLYHCGNEDIFLLKSLTHRPDDDQDLLVLAGTGLDGDVLRAEAEAQKTRSGENWPWIIHQALEQVEQRTGVRLPIKSEIV